MTTGIEVPPGWEEDLRNRLRQSARDPSHPLHVRYVNIQQMEHERRQALLPTVIWTGLALQLWRHHRDGLSDIAAASVASAGAVGALLKGIPQTRAVSGALTVAREQLEEQIARQVDNAGTALRMLEQWESEQFPYVLVLGNFALQADASLDSPSLSLFVSSLRRRMAHTPIISSVWRQRGFASWSVSAGPGLALRLASALEGRAYVITVTNAAAVSLEPTPNLGQLVVPPEDWLPYVVNLAKQCSMAVFDLAESSAGVRRELAALAEPELAKRTVIVWSDPERVKSAADAELAGRLLAGLSPEVSTPFAPDDPLLVPFSRRAKETDLDFDDLDAAPAIADLLERIAQLNGLSPEGRRKRMRADELFARIQALITSERADEASPALHEVRQLYSEIGMEARIAEVDLALGLISASRGKRETALSQWRSALKELESLDPVDRARLLASYQPTLEAFYRYGEDDDRERIEALANSAGEAEAH